MNKKRNAVYLCVIFVLQLLIPVGMVSYSSFIEWGLENRPSVYKFELSAVEWLTEDYVYLLFEEQADGLYEGTYCAVQTGTDGFTEFEVTDKKPKGDYIRSSSGRWFSMPVKISGFELQPLFSSEDYRWLYFVAEDHKHEWGWSQTENYFQSAYAEIHVFKGHAKTVAVYLDGQQLEDVILQCIEKGIRME